MAEAEDDTIAIVYKEDALGKKVWIQFPVADAALQFFQGTITRMTAAHVDDDIDKPLEYTHYVKFGDTDDGYYDLSDLEVTGYLRWAKPEDKKENETTTTPTTPTDPTTNTAASASARVVTPTKRANPSPIAAAAAAAASTEPERPTKKPKIKMEPGSSESNYKTGNDTLNLVEFEHWLRNVHLGARKNALSNANVRSVMIRVSDMVFGRGITYNRWPSHINFYGGTKIDLTFDFDKLLKEAGEYEDRYGKDLGHGWLLKHPLKKLLLYKKHLEEFGRNP